MKNSKEYEPCDMNKHLSETRFILFLAPYPKGSATALPEGAFVVYLSLKKPTRNPDPDEYPRHFLRGYSTCSLRAEATFSPFSRYELASQLSYRENEASARTVSCLGIRRDEVSCSTIFTVHYIIQLYSQNSDIIVFMNEQKPYPIKFLCWRKSYRV